MYPSNYKAQNLCMYIRMFVCTFVLHISQEPFIQPSSHLVGVLLGTQGCAFSNLV